MRLERTLRVKLEKAAERAERAETACNNPPPGFVNDINRLAGAVAAAMRRPTWRKPVGNWRKPPATAHSNP